MIFATFWFIAFCLVFFPVYWAVRRHRFRFVWLLLGCVLFHTHYAGPAGVFPIVVLGAVTYAAGLSGRRLWHIAGIVFCVLALAFYKYFYFFAQTVIGSIYPAWGAALADLGKALLPAQPPLAISFFAFEFVHYLVDVRKGHAPIKGPLDFSMFAIFFPSLVAGPIKRYEQFIPSLHSGLKEVNRRDVATGIIQIALGYLKKVIADNLTLYLDAYQDRFLELSLGERWFIFAAIGFRILLDFSGYSDIAIGLARMLGVRLPPNFDWPYLATNIQEFWRRWHISLSTWIRDYVYIPLGGNRHGPIRKVLNALFAFGLCGLWHGPAWNFILWGIYHGAGLAIAGSYRQLPFRIGAGIASFFSFFPVVGWMLTLFFVWIGWLLFFFPVDIAWNMALSLFDEF